VFPAAYPRPHRFSGSPHVSSGTSALAGARFPFDLPGRLPCSMSRPAASAAPLVESEATSLSQAPCRGCFPSHTRRSIQGTAIAKEGDSIVVALHSAETPPVPSIAVSPVIRRSRVPQLERLQLTPPVLSCLMSPAVTSTAVDAVDCRHFLLFAAPSPSRP